MALFSADPITLCHSDVEAAKPWWMEALECKHGKAPADWATAKREICSRLKTRGTQCGRSKQRPYKPRLQLRSYRRATALPSQPVIRLQDRGFGADSPWPRPA
jgi:hypothetical protein